MKKSLCFVCLVFLAWLGVAQAEQRLKPFVLASVQKADYAQTVADTKQKLVDAGFTIVGEYQPFGDNTVIVVTSPETLKIAAASPRGGYGAPQRIGVAKHGDEVEVSFANPEYFQYAYRLKGDMRPVAQQLKDTLGYVKDFGSEDGMTPRKLKKYHYMFSMPYFDDPYEFDEFDSYKEAVAELEKRLAKPGDAISKVYRIDIPGKQQTVFGVQFKATNEDEEDLDEQFQLGVVDYQRPSKIAYLPYEIMVNGKEVEAPHMKFRMAVHFPDLPMTGKHGFTKLMSAPGAIDDALEDLIEEGR
jgi:uncharacterized protein (DUF302 family)